MRASSTYLRIGTGVLALVVVVVVFLLDSPGDDDQEGAPPEPTPVSTPTPSPSPVSPEEFCAGFNLFAAANANHVANGTDESLLEVTAAAESLRQLASGTVMSPKARLGLEELIEGVLGETTAAPDQEAADALSAFLEVTCPAGGL